MLNLIVEVNSAIFLQLPASYLDQYTTYNPVLPEPVESQPGVIHHGEVNGRHYICVPDWMRPLPAQPAQFDLQPVTPTTGLITSFFAKSGMLQLVKARMDGTQKMLRYSLHDELTVSQVFIFYFDLFNVTILLINS